MAEPISRRQFQHRVVGTAASASLAGRGVSLAAEKSQAEGPFPRGRYVDIHTHIGQPWFGDEPLTVAKLLRWMDAHDVAQAAILPLVSPEAFYYPVSTDFVLRETRPHRDRLIPFCVIDPRTLTTHLREHKTVVDMLSGLLLRPAAIHRVLLDFLGQIALLVVPVRLIPGWEVA